MTDSRLSNEFIEVGLFGPTSDARLSNTFIEVASTVASQVIPCAQRRGDPTSDAEIPGWDPETPATYARPVQCEDATRGLTGAQLPNGRGILVWPTDTYDAVHYALVDSPTDFLIDDIVDIADVEEVMTVPAPGPGYIFRATVSVNDGELYVMVLRLDLDPATGGTGITDIYKANSPTLPTAWEHWGFIQNDAGLGTGVALAEFNVLVCSPILLLGNGRMLYCGSRWIGFLGNPTSRAGVWYSDNNGRTWTLVVSDAYHTGGGYLAYQSEQLAVDPTNGRLYFFTGSSAAGSNQMRIWMSADCGLTWDATFYNNTALRLSSIINNGERTWAMESVADLYQLPGGDDGTDTSAWVLDAADWLPAGGSAGLGDLNGITKGLRGLGTTPFRNNGIYYFWADRVAFSPGPPLCGPPPLLHIPFKDRLAGIILDPDTGQPTPESLATAVSQDFDNLKAIERWAYEFMLATDSSNGCHLHIPYKHYAPFSAPAAGFDNFKTIQRWADRVLDGTCGCGVRYPARCQLHIPFADALLHLLVDTEGRIDPGSLDLVALQEFDAYKTIERWGNRYANGECG